MRRMWLFGSAQQRIVAVLLAASLLYELSPAVGLTVDVPSPGEWLVLAIGPLMAGPALLVSRWPVRSGVAAAVMLVGWSLMLYALIALHLAGDRVADPVSGTASLAVLAMIVVVVRRTPPRTAAALVLLLLAAANAAEMIHDPWPDSITELVRDWIAPVVAAGGLAVAVGLYLRHRDTTTARAIEAAVTAARQRERVDLARELHDVVAHHIGGIVVQAQAAQVVAATDAGAGTRVLPVIEKAGVDALSAMRRMVSVLREGDLDVETPFRTMDLTADLHAVTATVPGGTPVRLTVDMAEPIPAEVGTSVLRLVQESVTNARRHAGGAHEITVTVRAGGGVARVSVCDDGRPGGEPKRYGGGFGLVGMRERVQLLGGQFSAGRGPGGGWQVLADVPLSV